MRGNVEIKPILNIEIDKYIEWYKKECEQSELKRWFEHELWTINKLRTQTNFYCGTYKSEVNARKYKDRIGEIYSKRVKEFNNFNQSIYHPTEWLVPTLRQWQIFDNTTKENPHIKELERLLSLCKDDLRAKKNVIKRFYKELKKDKITNLKAFKKGYVIQLNFFEKGSYYANENPEYMAYCKEHAFFSLIHDYAKVKALDYAFNLFKTLSETKDFETIKKLSLNPNFDDFEGQLITILKKTQPLFSSNISQWKNLFSNDIKEFDKPIELISKTNLSDLRLFLDKLKTTGLIRNGRFGKMLEDVKAFSFNGKIVTSLQYKRAKQIENYPNTLNCNDVIEVFKSLNLD